MGFLIHPWGSRMFKRILTGNPHLVVQWLGLSTFTAEGLGSVPSQGMKIPQVTRCGQIWRKEYQQFPKGKDEYAWLDSPHQFVQSAVGNVLLYLGLSVYFWGVICSSLKFNLGNSDSVPWSVGLVSNWDGSVSLH